MDLDIVMSLPIARRATQQSPAGRLLDPADGATTGADRDDTMRSTDYATTVRYCLSLDDHA